MTQPEQPKDPLPAESPTDITRVPNGVPHGGEDAEAKGMPHSDRQHTETAAKQP